MAIDPAITIRGILKSAWSLTGALDDTLIKFSTGWYDQRKVTPQITVTPESDDAEYLALGGDPLRVYEVFNVDVWITFARVSAAGPGLALQQKRDCRDEVLKILDANMKGLTDIDYLWLNTPGINLDEPEAEPPIARYRKQVTVVYDL